MPSEEFQRSWHAGVGRGHRESAALGSMHDLLQFCLLVIFHAIFLLFRSVCDATSSGGFCGTSFAARDVNLPAASREVLCIHHLSFILCFRGVIFVCQVGFHLSSIFGATELQEQSFCIVFC